MSNTLDLCHSRAQAYVGAQSPRTNYMQRTPFWRRTQAFLRRLFGPQAGGSSDPFVGVREPTKRGPRGRTAATAVMEPDDDGVGVIAVGGGHRSRLVD